MKRSNMIAMSFIGCYIPTTDLNEWLDECLTTRSGDAGDDIRLVIKNLTTEDDRRLLNDIFMFPREYVYNADPGTDEDGWYIGVDAFLCQESASIKRIKLDLRNVFIKSRMIFDDDSSMDVVECHPVILDMGKIKTKANKYKAKE